MSCGGRCEHAEGSKGRPSCLHASAVSVAGHELESSMIQGLQKRWKSARVARTLCVGGECAASAVPPSRPPCQSHLPACQIHPAPHHAGRVKCNRSLRHTASGCEAGVATRQACHTGTYQHRGHAQCPLMKQYSQVRSRCTPQIKLPMIHMHDMQQALTVHDRRARVGTPCEHAIGVHVNRRGRALGMKQLWRPEHRCPVTALTQSLAKSKQSQRQIGYGVTEVIMS